MVKVMNHYFSNNKNLKDDFKQFEITINTIKLTFKTNSGVFSKEYLDYGTKVLLENLEFDNPKSILDCGCGYGPIGIYSKKVNPNADVTMVDINQRAVELAKDNSKLNNCEINTYESDLLENVKNTFDMIISNPPIRTGKQNIFNLYEQAFLKLNPSGTLWIVIQKKQGANSTIKKLEELFKVVEIITKDKGYFILKATKSIID